jgi:recombination DNA repair RAD52 pathway protein
VTYLSPAQIAQLLKPINPVRVHKDGKGFSHVEAYDVRAHLTRIFGFGRWSEEVLSQELIFETLGAADDSNAKSRGKWTLAYRALVRLTVHAEDGTALAVYTESAVGDVQNYPQRADAHDMAIKTAQSQAFKRCAVNLGDQFGLSLYNKGTTNALVKATLVAAPAPAEGEEPAESVDEHITELAREDEPAEDTRERSTPPEREAKNKPAARGNESQSSSTSTEPRDETTEAVAALNETFEGATVAEPEPSEKEHALAQIGQMVALARETESKDEVLQILKQALELAVSKNIRGHRLPNGETVGASLTSMMTAAAQR